MNTTFKLLFVPVAIASVIAVKQVQYCFTDAHTIIKYLDYDQKEMRDANAYEEKQAPYFQIAGEVITAQTGSTGNFSYLGGRYCSHIDLPDNKILAFDESNNVWLTKRDGDRKLRYDRKGSSYLPSLTKLANGKILITGGYSSFLEGATDDIEVYDPKTDEFKLVGKLLTTQSQPWMHPDRQEIRLHSLRRTQGQWLWICRRSGRQRITKSGYFQIQAVDFHSPLWRTDIDKR